MLAANVFYICIAPTEVTYLRANDNFGCQVTGTSKKLCQQPYHSQMDIVMKSAHGKYVFRPMSSMVAVANLRRTWLPFEIG